MVDIAYDAPYSTFQVFETYQTFPTMEVQEATATLSAIQQRLVEEFGNIYEGYGFKRVQGLIVGLLLTQATPSSLDDMVTLLGRSKGPISTAVRELAARGLIRKVSGPVNRRDYYVADPDLFFNNFKFNMATVRKNRLTAERFLSELSDDDGTPASHAGTVDNLKQMLAFYALMESFYETFSEKWEQAKQQINRA